MFRYHPMLLLTLALVVTSNGSTEPTPVVSDCLQGFADIGALPVNVTTNNEMLYNVLSPGLHSFPKVKFLCDGMVKRVEMGLFYTTAVNMLWYQKQSVELLLMTSESHAECSSDKVNCFRIEQNLGSKAAETELFNIISQTGSGAKQCIEFPNNTVLSVSMDFSTPMMVQRGDYLSLNVPRSPEMLKCPAAGSLQDNMHMGYEAALPVIYTGSNCTSPFIAIPQGSFLPSEGWEEQLASTANCPCSWATGVIVGILLIAAVVIVILGAIIVILWRRMKHTMATKLEHKQHHDYAVGNVVETPGGSLQVHTESAEYAVVGDIADAELNARPLPELPSEITESQEDTYWCPAGTEQGIYEQLRAKRLLKIVDKLVILDTKLGQGEFGEVYRGLWKVPGRGDPMEVAAKIPKGNSEGNRIKVLQEAAILGQFNHPRVAKLCGMVTLGNPIMMVMELLPNGDLCDHLKEFNRSPKDPDLPKKLLQFCLEIADGMSYLSEKGFIHRDLAARNVLLDKEWHCKITDFGMSRSLDENAYYTTKGGRIPLRWTAPEAILYRKYTSKSDVWSYGMVMYEIWSLGHKPFQNVSVEEVIKALKSAYCQPPPPGCPREVYEVMVDCWTPTYDDRPDFSSLVTMLEKVEREATEHFHSGEYSSVTMKLGAPLEDGAEMYKELQNKHQRSSK